MSLSLDLNRFAARAGKRADQVVRKVCLDLTRDVVMGTPVRSGRAKGNWQASTANQVANTTERNDREGSATVAAAAPAIQRAPGSVFYLANNLPYIYRLEYLGWSQQAPSGWVRMAMERVRASIA